MGYDGWLIKVSRDAAGNGGYKIPLKYIKADSYSAYVNMQDLDPWTDADGYAHRTAVELKAEKIEFETPAMMTNITFGDLMRNIQAQYNVEKARQLWIQAYIPEYDDYIPAQLGYLADFQPQIYYADNELKKGNKVIQYNPIRMAFVGGVYPG